MSSLREVAEAAKASGQGRDITTLSEFYRAATPETVLALLDVVDALDALVTLKDGRRGPAYEAVKPLAWQAARETLARLPEDCRRARVEPVFGTTPWWLR